VEQKFGSVVFQKKALCLHWIYKILKMKRVLIAFAVFALLISAISCKKCVTCKYEYPYLGDTVVVSFPDECGKSSEIKAFKDEKTSEAMRYGTDLTCEDVK
jgi:hypothetical protein